MVGTNAVLEYSSTHTSTHCVRTCYTYWYTCRGYSSTMYLARYTCTRGKCGKAPRMRPVKNSKFLFCGLSVPRGWHCRHRVIGVLSNGGDGNKRAGRRAPRRSR
jgi:hypothetical protein